MKLQCNGSLYWDTFIIPSDIAVKEDWKIYQLIKATSQGLGNVTASLAYHTGNAERTEVTYFCHHNHIVSIVEDIIYSHHVQKSFLLL